MKFCKDCDYFVDYGKNYRFPPPPSSPKCNHEMALESIDLVWGGKEYSSCTKMREDISLCGPLARFYK